MASWQRPARLALGVFAVGFALALWFIMGERQEAAPPPAVDRLEAKEVSVIKGGDVVRVKGPTRDIRVEFNSQTSYTDGTRKLSGFKANIDNRGGRSIVVSGNEAWIGAGEASYDIRGDVTLNTSDGFSATTPHASFTEAEGILRGDGPIKFSRARVSGSGVGFSYDRQTDRLWLNDRAVINVAPQDGRGAMAVTAGAAGHSRAERYMRFERGMTMTRDGQVIRADESTAFLLKDRDEPEHVELRGNASVDGATGTGSLQAMRARDINLRYGPDGRTLQHALLVGQAGVQLARADGSPGTRLGAETINAALAGDGSVTRLDARDRVEVTLPSTADAPARTVTATVLNGAGEEGKGLTSMTFDEGVEFREAAAAGGHERIARSRTLQAEMAESGTIDQATFTTGFRFENGKFRADSGNADYQVTKGTLSLRSAEGVTRPHLEDERVTLDARDIDVTLDPRRITAGGNVVMQLRPGRRRADERGTSLLSDSEAVIVDADELELDDATGLGQYSGKEGRQARVSQLQSGTSIKGDIITINEKTGMLNASGKVVTTLPVAAKPTTGGPATSLAQAGQFQFDDSKRLAVFTTQAQFDGSQGNLRAQRIELYLAAGDNTLERLEATSDVTIKVEQREARGASLSYKPADEQYLLQGAPVRFVEGCQETTGRTLTFFRGSDRVLIDGREEIRVEAKGGKCQGATPPR
jgi:lipopolysaccharide export system protein LptA